MGYMCHHSIVVTSCMDEQIQKAHKMILKLQPKMSEKLVVDGGNWVSPISPKTTNGYRSFFIAPDGSKEGWDGSNRGDSFREKVIKILDSFAYEDESTSLDYVEVQYADEEHDNKVLRASR